MIDLTSPLLCLLAALLTSSCRGVKASTQGSSSIDDSSADPSVDCPYTAAMDGALATALALNVPPATETVNAEFEHGDFWAANGDLLRRAWEDWGGGAGPSSAARGGGGAATSSNLTLSDVLDPDLAASVRSAIDSPTLATELAVRSLWTGAVPEAAGASGRHEAYRTRLLTEDGVRLVRSELDRASNSGIPTRRPNGMNRHGFIIDDEVDGAVSLPSLTAFVRDLVDDVGRPVGRMLFPDTVGEGDDAEYFAFTIRYMVGEDVKLDEHRDASVVTINVNLNLPEEGYGGSSLYLVDGDDPTLRHSVDFDSGMAVVHRGSLRHGALPISEGTRHNLVIWLFGENGTVRIAPYAEDEQLTVEERWNRRATRPKEDPSHENEWDKILEFSYM